MRHPRPGVLNRLVICGVAASGKTTLGAALAVALDWPFVEGDDLHPPANVAKMAAGVPLDDADRAPWLAAIAVRLAVGGPLIVTCSALKRAYRDRLRAAAPGLRFVYLGADAALVSARCAARRGHFMPPALIASQFATLQIPGSDEDIVTVAAVLPVAAQVAAVRAALSAR